MPGGGAKIVPERRPSFRGHQDPKKHKPYIVSQNGLSGITSLTPPPPPKKFVWSPLLRSWGNIFKGLVGKAKKELGCKGPQILEGPLR